MNIPTLKDLTLEMLKNMPDSISLEEMMYRINIVGQVIDGLKEVKQNETVSTDNLLNRFDALGK